ncbi:SDR family NAD(P)-dependent oxidoreductase [Imbroritus primus]|uniref:SDR family NAD(P)-dependent oxidoreductase n=1 Tax=Imbroritus primus TaxID=3058603 RepID=A0ACD3SQ94_9BURK|nr:SDR family NAD(P)-dependent oxidoreductase [Burkholderiaceae bacterium PBA]
MMRPLNAPVVSWAGKRVWIIGASTGIGAALARALAERGARLALSARSAEALAATVVQGGAAGLEHARLLPCDVTNAGAVTVALDSLVADWGGVDLVLVSAGAYHPMRADALDREVAAHLIDTNLKGPLNVAASAVPQLLRQGGGAIGIIGSVAGYGGLPKAVVYGPTKAAIINLCEAMYFDLHASGIGVYLISPGFVRTPMTAANDFRMPALISPEEAARDIVRGMEAGAFEIHFPRRFTCALKLLRLLPYRLYFAIVRRITGL